MQLKHKCLLGALLILVLVSQALADHDDDRRKRHRERERYGWSQHQRRYTPDPLHQRICGQCHFALPAMLLPAASWQKIMGGLNNHFGETIELDARQRLALSAFLNDNAADKSGHKRARKIMSSLGSLAPVRVSDIPYLKRKHREGKLPAGAFERNSVGSMANCKACHPGAARADFDDDRVRIPD